MSLPLPQVLILALAVLGPLPAQYPEARVWRDKTGVPHIESQSPLGLFHAVGYMQAADQLPWIALNTLGMTGRMAETFGPGGRNESFIFAEAHVLNDVIVKFFGIAHDQHSWVSAFSSDYRARMQAFVDGVRRRCFEIRQPAHPDHREWQALAPWIRSTIEGLQPWQLASYSRWNKLVLAFGNALVDDPHPESAEAVDPGDRLARRKSIAGQTGSWASNGLAWAATYVQDQHPDHDDGKTYMWSGAAADPHTGVLVPVATGNYHPWDLPGNNTFMAHLRLLDPSGNAVWSSFGWSQPGNPYFLVSHNPNVAAAGSAGAPNLADCMLLRVQTDAQGSPVVPPAYYHPWRDTNLNSGGDPVDFAPFSKVFLDVRVLENGTVRTRRYDTYRTDFGVVFNPNIFWVSPQFLALPHRVTSDAVDEYFRMWSKERGMVSRTRQPGWVPVVTAYRFPQLDDLFDRFDDGAWAIMKAGGVPDVWQTAIDNLAFSFSVNFACADDAGRLLSCLLGAVPRRLAGLSLPGLSPIDPLRIYGKANRVPVPMLGAADLVWDWDPAGGFLRPHGNAASNRLGLLSYSLFDPIAFQFEPPLQLPQLRPNLPPTYENPGFLTESNDMPWHAWKRMGFGDDPGNARVAELAAAGTLYQIWDFFSDPFEKNQIWVKEFEDRMLLRKPPFTLPEVLDEALGTHVYQYEFYPDARYNRMPVAVRMVAECADELVAGTLNQEIAEDVRFFQALWQNLGAPAAGSLYADPSPLGMASAPLLAQLTAAGRTIAVRGTGGTVLETSPLPLLSFAWDSLTFPGGLRLDGARVDPVAAPVFSAADIAAIGTLAARLRAWNGDLGPQHSQHALLRATLDSIVFSADCAGSFAHAALQEGTNGPDLLVANDPCAQSAGGTGAAYTGQPLPSLSGLHRTKRPLGVSAALFDPPHGRDRASWTRAGATTPLILRQRPPLAAVVDQQGARITQPTATQMLDVLSWLYQFRNGPGQAASYPFTAAMHKAILLQRLQRAHAELVLAHGAAYDWNALCDVRVFVPLPVIGTFGSTGTVAYQRAGPPGAGGVAFHAAMPVALQNGVPVRYVACGGSCKPIVTTYAQDAVSRLPAGAHATWYWNFPGQRVWPWSAHYADHADNYRTKTLHRALLEPQRFRDWSNRSPEVQGLAQWPLVLR